MVGDWKNLCQPSPFLDYPQIEVDPAIASVRPWPGHKFPQRVNLGPSSWLTPFLACLPCQASVAGRGAGQDSCGGSRHWLYRWIMESWLYLCCCEVVGIPKKGFHSRIWAWKRVQKAGMGHVWLRVARLPTHHLACVCLVLACQVLECCHE